MRQSPSPRGTRSDPKPILAGAGLSIVAHVAAFAFVGFHIDGALASPEPSPAPAFDDHEAVRLVTIVDAHVPAPDSRATWAPNAGRDGGGAASAGGPRSESGPGSAQSVEPDISAPPVLLTFRQTTSSPLLLAASDEPSSDASSVAVRAASYTPGGVRAAKRSWSGQGDVIARRNGRIRDALGVGFGDGHCPTRPPARGPLGL